MKFLNNVYEVPVIPLISSFLMVAASSNALLQEDYSCDLQVYLPFTVAGEYNYTSTTNMGFSQMAATVMAMKHFNDRNTVVVPELEGYQDCPVHFDFNRTKVFDSEIIGHAAGRSFQKHLYERSRPCAIVGTMDDFPALELSTLAATSNIPLVVNRALNRRVSDPEYSPNTVQMFPHLQHMAFVFWEYLKQIHDRSNYLSFVYAVSDQGLQKLEALSVILTQAGVRWTAHPYLSPEKAEFIPERSIYRALQEAKRTGHRTMVVAMENPYAEIHEMAEAANDLELNDPYKYFWVWFGEFEFFHISEAQSNSTLRRLIQGSAWMAAIDPFWLREVITGGDSYFDAWEDQTSETVDLLNRLNPISPGQVGYQAANSSFFQTYTPEYASSFAYDTVMSVGIGACAALEALPKNSSLSVDGFMAGIRSVNFSGASGRVQFGANRTGHPNQARYGPDVIWSGYNIIPLGDTDIVIATPDIRHAGSNEWTRRDNSEFFYASNRTRPPVLLRDESFENYLPSAARAFGLSLMSVAVCFAVGSAAWVYANRKHRVLLAAQPPFLYALCVGAIVTSLTIVPLSMDEKSGLDTEQLDRACMAVPWLFITGYVITYSALFSKLWRVSKVLQFTRRRVKLRHVLWPAAVLFLSAVLVLILWTTFDGLEWVRSEVNDGSGETVGRCKSENISAFVFPLLVIMLIPSLLTEFMAWKTKDVDGAYSESVWIFVMVLLQMEVVLFSVPLLVILNEQSTTANYVGIVLISWVFPMSSLGLVMLPKFLAFHKAKNGTSGATRTRGSRGGSVYVSGIGPPRGGRDKQNGGGSNTPVTPTKPSHDSEDMVAAQLAMRAHISTVVVAHSDVDDASRLVEDEEDPAEESPRSVSLQAAEEREHPHTDSNPSATAQDLHEREESISSASPVG